MPIYIMTKETVHFWLDVNRMNTKNNYNKNSHKLKKMDFAIISILGEKIL